MGQNSSPKEDLITTIAALISVVFTIIAFYGFGKWGGFIEETEYAASFDVAGLGEFVAGPFGRYIHLAIIPSLIGLLVSTVEGFPLLGGYTKKRTLSPLNLALITAANFAIQLLPAIFSGSNPTWLSDKLMVPWGYVLLSLIFFLAIGTGIYFAIFGWLYQRNATTHFGQNIIISIAFIYFSVLAFIGSGMMLGFLAEFQVDSIDEYVHSFPTVGEGILSLLNVGPVKRYSHLIIIPAFIGLAWYFIYKVPFLGRKILDKVGKKTKAKSMEDSKRVISRIGSFALGILLIQILPSILYGSNPTWLSDLVMINWGGYTLFSFTFVFGTFYGLYKALTGGLIGQWIKGQR